MAGFAHFTLTYFCIILYEAVERWAFMDIPLLLFVFSYMCFLGAGFISLGHG
jgi:hypothetical protein